MNSGQQLSGRRGITQRLSQNTGLLIDPYFTGAKIRWLLDNIPDGQQRAERGDLACGTVDSWLVWDLTNKLVQRKPNHAVRYRRDALGLGAPYWDAYARGAVVGLSGGTTRARIARAALESIAYQTRDVLDAMRQDAGLDPNSLRVDGGATANDFLMQFQADILGIPVERSAVKETTALGAGYLAGMAVGFWESPDDIADLWRADRRFEPRMRDTQRTSLYADWHRAVERASAWARE